MPLWLAPLERAGLPPQDLTAAKEIRADGVLCVHDGEEVFYAGDNVVYAVGQRPKQEEALALNYCAPEIYYLGDCVTPKNLTEATTAGFMAAKNIGRI